MALWVLDKRKKPFMPCSDKQVRLLWECGRGHRLVYRQRENSVGHVRVRLEPGSQTTGVALVREKERTDPNTMDRHLEQTVFALLERAHRGQAIREALTQRRESCRRRRGHLGRVAIRARGSFNIETGNGLVQGIHHRSRTLIQRADGHGYSLTKITLDKGEAGMEQALCAALSLPGMNAGVSRANG